MNAIAQMLIDEIDGTTAPESMSKAYALETLEQIIEGLKGRCEALRDEIANEDAG